MKNEKLIDRMKKLLAMSEDCGSENEAMIAARRLHALMSKHDMTLSDLTSDEEETGDEQIMSDNRPYLRIIAAGIAKLYYCEMYYIRGVSKKKAPFVFVGKPHHRLAAVTIFQNVARIISRESQAESRRTLGGRDTRFINSFRNGAARRIHERCMELIELARAGNLVDEETGDNLPALASLYDTEKAAIEAFLANENLTTMKPRRTANDRAGMAAGREAANKVPLQQGIAQTAPKMLN